MPREVAPGFADVSVIIPAFQASGTIGRALASVARQTLKPRQAVVVDDGSTDATYDVANACAHQMNGIELRVFRTDENRGAGAARNRAIEESTGSILAFLDADDEWMPEKLQRSLSYLEGSNFALVAHDYLTGDGDGVRHHHCVRRFQEERDPFVSLYRKGFIPSASVVAKRDVVIDAGGFDPDLPNAQDFDLWLSMTRRPDRRFLVFGEPLLRYHLTPGGIMSYTDRRLRCGLVIAARYFPDLKARPGSPLASLWIRVAALHLEAFQAHRRRGNVFRLMAIVARFPFSVVGMTVTCLLAPPDGRGRFLTTEAATEADP